MKRSAVALLLALTLCASFLSGCQPAIPHNGVVQAGAGIPTNSEQRFVFNPERPVDGATPEQIVRGFLVAASNSGNDYLIAREFLTADCSKRWRPGLNTIIDREQRTFSGDNNRIVATVKPVSAVDEHGALSESIDAESVQLPFDLEQHNGQWRISAAPDAVVLDQSTFETAFREHSLYFLVPNTNLFVGQQRWFAQGPNTASKIMTELLRGPVGILAAPVSATAFPEGTQLVAETVPIAGGVARIDLSAAAAGADRTTLEKMLAQTEASLAQVDGVNHAVISVEQTEVIAGPTDVSTVRFGAAGTAQLAALTTGDVFGKVSSAQFAPVAGFTAVLSALQPESVQLSRENNTAIIRSATGVYRLSAGPAPATPQQHIGSEIRPVDPASPGQLLDDRPDLIDPGVDPFGYVWTVPRTEATALRVQNGVGGGASVAASWTRADEVNFLRLSRDGTRIAVVTRCSGAYTLEVFGVARDASGKPLSLTADSRRYPLAAAPIDLDWVGEQRIALAKQADAPQVDAPTASEITIVNLGGFTTSIGFSGKIVSIAGVGGSSVVHLLDSYGMIRERRGSNWQATLADVRILAKIG